MNKFWRIRDCIEQNQSTPAKSQSAPADLAPITDAWMSSSQEQPSLAQILRAAQLSPAQISKLQKHKPNTWLLF